eukprot:gene3198-2352_t
MGGRGGGRSLEEENEIIHQQWKSNLAQCENCGRSFLPEKLPVHQRSCTSSNPAKRVSGSFRSEAAETWDGRGSTNTFQESSSTSGGKRGGAAASYRGSSFVDDDRTVGGQQSFGRSGKAPGGLDQYRDTPEYGHLIKCRECGRNFNPDSYDKHAKICRKVFKTKRKPYDSAKHRVMGTELAAYYDGRGRMKNAVRASSLSSTAMASSSGAMYASQSSGATGGGGNRRSRAASGSKWRQQSSAFREAIRQAKMVTVAEQKSKATGVPLHLLLPANTGRGGGGGGGGYEIDSSYMQCPHCGRSFNQKAGERHIPQCQNIINKPRRLSGHSGAPSYSTNTPAMMSSGAAAAPRVSSGGRGFGMSTRASALNNRAISRWSDAGGSDSGRMHEMQMMAPSKTHHMSDPVRFNSNNASSSSTRGYASLGGGSSPPSAANANSSSMTARRRSFGSATNDRGGGYGYEATGSTSMRTSGGEARSSSRPRGRLG